MSHECITIKFSGVALDVKGNFREGYSPSHYDPGEPDLFELGSVFWNGKDISSLVCTLDRVDGEEIAALLELLRWRGSLISALEGEALSQRPLTIEPDAGPDTDGFGY
jgi:hypothetical protein